jgi:antitoxin HicB
MIESTYPILLLKLPDNEGGGYVAYAPDLEGCKSNGESPDAAVASLLAAIRALRAHMTEEGKPAPEPFSSSDKAQRMREEMLSIIREQEKMLKEEVVNLRKELSEVRSEMDKIRTRMRQLALHYDISDEEVDEMLGEAGVSPQGGKTSDKRRLLN